MRPRTQGWSRTRVRAGAVLVAALGSAIATLGVHAVSGTVGPDFAACDLSQSRVAYAGDDGRIWTARGDGSESQAVSSVGGLSPTWSPDGARIAFRHLGAQGSDIYVAEADGRDEHKITDGGENWSPAWSPDGTKIAYSRDLGEGQRIVVATPDGHMLANLTADQEGEYPAWSPDGTRIAFASFRNNYDIWIMDADGSNKRNLTRSSSYDMYPAWSPDGSKIAFGTDRGIPHVGGDYVQQEIYVMNADGTNVRNSTGSRSVADGFPAWAPNGELTWIRGNDPAHPPMLWAMQADGSARKSLGIAAQFPAWQPASDCDRVEAGGALAFSRLGRDDHFDIYVQMPGTDARNLTDSPADDTFPSWAPDGEKLLYISGQAPGHGHLIVSDPLGTNRRDITPSSVQEVRSASWSPDGTRIAFSVFDSGGAIYLVDADGTNLRRLATTSASDSPTWSPDGRSIAYRKEFPGNDEIVRVDLLTGKTIRLTHTAVGINDLSPSWSPSGSSIAYSRGLFPRESVWLMNADGSAATRLTLAGTEAAFPSWSPLGDKLVFQRHGEPWIINADGEEERSALVGEGNFPVLRPDGRPRAPVSLSLRVQRTKLRGRTAVVLAGSVTSAGWPIANAKVLLCRFKQGGSVRIGEATTSAAGQFRLRRILPQGTAAAGTRLVAFFSGDTTTRASVVLAAIRPMEK